MRWLAAIMQAAGWQINPGIAMNAMGFLGSSPDAACHDAISACAQVPEVLVSAK